MGIRVLLALRGRLHALLRLLGVRADLLGADTRMEANVSGNRTGRFVAVPNLTEGPTVNCTEDDHDTTDLYCGGCGLQLCDDGGSCDWCQRGQHDSEGYPFCRCCGTYL